MRRFSWPPFSSVCWERLSNRERLCGTSQRARGACRQYRQLRCAISTHGTRHSASRPERSSTSLRPTACASGEANRHGHSSRHWVVGSGGTRFRRRQWTCRCPLRRVCRQAGRNSVTSASPSSDHDRGLDPVKSAVNTARLT